MGSQGNSLNLALVGMGSAGQARARALANVPGLSLAAQVSRRPGAGTHRFQDILTDPGIDAVAISTENTQHAAMARECLDAGKHVLCDYPLAFSRKEAEGLFSLAREKNKVLHAEHIGLLASNHQDLKKRIAELGNLRKGEYLFQGGFSEKLRDPEWTGPLPFLSVSRLLQVADLFGDFEALSHEFVASEKGFRLHLHLRFAWGGILGFTEERMEGLPLRRSLQIQSERGPLAWKAASFSGGLFGKDLEWFRDRIVSNQTCYYDEGRMLRCLEVLEKIKKGRSD